MFGYGYGMGMGFGWLWMLAILIFTISLVLWIVKSLFAQSNVQNETAMEILHRRYAKGEIDKAKFEELKNDLLESNRARV
ncbi:MAG TPA: SHOCT domain-containing protein [Trueperaceae bacterium]|nr:SHOCT domain-containing protein [Trueperaceae bacterium]